MVTSNNSRCSTDSPSNRWVDSPASNSSSSLSSSNSSSLARQPIHLRTQVSLLQLLVPLMLPLPQPIPSPPALLPTHSLPLPPPATPSEVVVSRSLSLRTPGPSSMRMMTRLLISQLSECQRKRSKKLQLSSPLKRQKPKPRLTPSYPTRASLQPSSS